MFDHIPTYNFYRTLGLESPMMGLPSGDEDVWALQKALDELGFEVGTSDGLLGPKTDQAIRAAQERYLLVRDGLAGGNTQKALVLNITSKVAAARKVRYDAMMGQLEWESGGFRLGAYSPPRDNGSFDAGIAQRNSEHTALEQGFDPYLSIVALAIDISTHHALFEGLPPRRRYILAQGAWNAPAYACYIAREEGAKQVMRLMTAKPSAASRNTLEEYMTKVSKYLSI